MQPCRSCLPQMTLPRTKLHTQLPFQPGSSLPCTCSRDLLQKSCMQTRPTAPSQASSCYLLSDSRETRLQQSTAGSFLALGMPRQGSHLTNQLTSSLHDCSPCRCDQEHVIFNLGADLPAITPSSRKPAPSSPPQALAHRLAQLSSSLAASHATDTPTAPNGHWFTLACGQLMPSGPYSSGFDNGPAWPAR